ncbi:citrate lyase subunit beta/citryl-CoA lyase [Spinactinospora alkalitolerans]|uniref:Citrate lyase subunit beta/citryl-CoA lyase n=1 Tax=Spinactinospora alkalitolerans TaxID=687207 RepID=A0A852TPP8_9ACTN|nr:CoA ester lyase [Spinactinospora alkalitolerans]NYE45969.1 citrate lyase subunit beta/citryl-CoA lyase [Spinactinospora alkalitolerans]
MSASTAGRPPRSWLYVPATRPDRVAKALGGAAEAVVVDLEDAVPAAAKESARAAALELAEGAERPFHVRVNDLAGPWGRADLRALARSPVAGVRLPKVESAEQVREAAEALADAAAPVALHVLLESALGVERAHEIATAHPWVAGVSLGEADLRASLRVTADAGLDWARSRVVTAARAAGLPGPVQSVYTDVADEEGLRASSERGRAMGFFGRSVIHPRQVPAVHAAYTPNERERAEAAELLAGLEAAGARGSGAFLTADGRFVDPAVVQAARAVVAFDPATVSEHEGNTP